MTALPMQTLHNNFATSSMMMVMDVEDITHRIRIMRMQENTCCYIREDYLARKSRRAACEIIPHSLIRGKPVDEDCRFKMAEWCFQIADYCQFKRETVETAMSCLDRFLQTESGRHALSNRTTFQLAAMSAFYTAIKISEPTVMEPQTVSALSKGCYSTVEITEMELQILEALLWRVNPPTSLSFVDHLLALIPATAMSESVRKVVFDIAKYQTELAVGCYSLISVKPSVIALSSILNAIEAVDHTSLSECTRKLFVDRATAITGMSAFAAEVIDTQWKLAMVVPNNLESENLSSAFAQDAPAKPAFSSSPVTVPPPFFETSPRSVVQNDMSQANITQNNSRHMQ